MTSVPSWNEFIREHLLSKSLFCGACLLAQNGDKVYTQGQLDDLTQSESQQFVKAFQTTSQTAEQEIVQKGFSLRCLRAGQEECRQFKIYSKTYSSIYCTSSDSQLGMTVNKLPYGLLICLYSNSVTAAKAVKQVEQFCDKLRS